MDAVAIFDDVEIPKERVFLDGDTVGYSEVITDTGWRGHIMHQAFTRAYVKLTFAFGLGHLMAETTGVVRFDHIQEKLGQIWNMVELTRSALVAAEAGAALDEGGVWYPDERPFLALRGEMPKWMPRVNELLQLIGGGGFMCTPSEADLHGPLRRRHRQVLPGGRRPTPSGASALFRLAWDFVGSDLGGRGELYERFYLSDSYRMTGARLQDRRQDAAAVDSSSSSCRTDRVDRRAISLPLSPRAGQVLVPAPPWHYVGDFLVIEYWADPDAVRGGAAARPRAATRRPRPGGRAVRRLAVLLGRAATSCSTRRAASTASSSWSSTRCSTASTSRPARTSGWIATSRWCAAGSRGSRRSSARCWMTRAFALGRQRRPRRRAGRALRRDARRQRPAAGRGHGDARARGARRARPTTTRRSQRAATSRGWPLGSTTTPAVHELVRAQKPRPLDLQI